MRHWSDVADAQWRDNQHYETFLDGGKWHYLNDRQVNAHHIVPTQGIQTLQINSIANPLNRELFDQCHSHDTI